MVEPDPVASSSADVEELPPLDESGTPGLLATADVAMSMVLATGCKGSAPLEDEAAMPEAMEAPAEVTTEVLPSGLTGGMVPVRAPLVAGGDEGGVIERPTCEGDWTGDPNGLGTIEGGGEGVRDWPCRVSMSCSTSPSLVLESAMLVGMLEGHGGGTIGTGTEALAEEDDWVSAAAETSAEQATSKVIPTSSNPASSSGIASTPTRARLLHSSGAKYKQVSGPLNAK